MTGRTVWASHTVLFCLDALGKSYDTSEWSDCSTAEQELSLPESEVPDWCLSKISLLQGFEWQIFFRYTSRFLDLESGQFFLPATLFLCVATKKSYTGNCNFKKHRIQHLELQP